MKRNRFVGEKKIKNVGAWVFLILSLIVVTTMYAWAEKEKLPKTYREENIVSTQKAPKSTDDETIKFQIENSTSNFPENISEIRVSDIELEDNHEEFFEASEEINNSFEEEINLSKSENSLMNTIVFAESGTCSQEVQKGIAWTIFNRIESEKYPNSVEEVIFDENQYSPVEGDKIFFDDWPDNETHYHREVEETDITEQVKESVKLAIAGDNPIGNMTGFYSLRWISSKELAIREKAGFYSSDWVLDENLNLVEPTDLNVIVIDGIVFHGDWTVD